MPEHRTDPEAVEAVLTASRTLVAIATQSLGRAAEETTIAQYRTLVVLASRGPQRLGDLAGALAVAPSTAGRMCDRLVRKGLIRRHRDRSDRRSVLVCITPAGRRVVDEATARRTSLIAGIMSRLPTRAQREVAHAMRAFADAAGEVPDSDWPSGAAFGSIARQAGPLAAPPAQRRTTIRPDSGDAQPRGRERISNQEAL